MSFDYIPNMKDYRESAVHIKVTDITEEDTHTIFLIDYRKLVIICQACTPIREHAFLSTKTITRETLSGTGQTALLGVDSVMKMSILYFL